MKKWTLQLSASVVVVTCLMSSSCQLLHAFLSTSASRARGAQVRLVAQALTTSPSCHLQHRSYATSEGKAQHLLFPSRLHGLASSTSTVLRAGPRFRTLTSSPDKETQYQDLDAALEELLGDLDDTITGTRSVERVQTQIQAPPPKKIYNPKQSFEEIDVDDLEVRSIHNPRWIEAGLSPDIVQLLSEKNITHFTPVQAQTFEPVVSGRDVIGRSRTGTGKTLAFGLPTLTRLVDFTTQNGKRDRAGMMRRGRAPSMLILTPTRELARQVQEELAVMARPLKLHIALFHGGVSYEPQAQALRQGVDVIVGTPGRIYDHMERGSLTLSECEIVVLDEADRMLDMGFAESVETILEGVGAANETKTQFLMFSATTPPWVKQIGRRYQDNVVSVDSTGDDGGSRLATTVRHLAIQVPSSHESRNEILEDLIVVGMARDVEAENDEDISSNRDEVAKSKNVHGKTIIFAETKREADELARGALFQTLRAEAIHGDCSQGQRDSVLASFRKGDFDVLVATDVASRGLDIPDVNLVIQLKPPKQADDYVHRSGRTGRAGKKGKSILLYTANEAHAVARLERDFGHDFRFESAKKPSVHDVLAAAAASSTKAIEKIPEETAEYFREAATKFLDKEGDPSLVVARCLALISKKTSLLQDRSLLTGKAGMTTLEAVNKSGKPLESVDVAYAVSKLARMSRDYDDLSFGALTGRTKPQSTGAVAFDMPTEDAKRLLKLCATVDTGSVDFFRCSEIDEDQFSDYDELEKARKNSRGGNSGSRFASDNYRGGYGGGNRSGGGGSGYRGGYSERDGRGYTIDRSRTSNFGPDRARRNGGLDRTGTDWGRRNYSTQRIYSPEKTFRNANGSRDRERTRSYSDKPKRSSSESRDGRDERGGFYGRYRGGASSSDKKDGW